MSTPSSATFLARFPEFAAADTDLIDVLLSEAVLSTDLEVWGDKWTMGVLYYVAEQLALSPQGRKMRLVNNDGETVYTRRLKTLRRLVSSAGYRVL